MKVLKFAIFERPMPHQRPRFSKFGHAYNTPEQVRYQKNVARAALSAKGDIFFTGYVSISVRYRFARPKSDKKKERTFFAGRGDADNFLKNTLDSMNGVIWTDDSQVKVIEYLDMQYTDGKEHTLIEIKEIV
jgi:Holliday junction resolvase RusA-like endonuclease